VLEVERLEVSRVKAVLLHDKFEFVTRANNQLTTALRADADPIQTPRRVLRPIGLDCHFEMLIVQC
jgi:hypothetical protein